MPNLSILSGRLQELGEELFGGASTETRGTRVYFRGLELFLVAYTMYFCFTWGHYIREFITSVLLPLGLAQYIDVSFLFEGHSALLLASLVAFLSVLGFFRVWRPAYLLALLGFHVLYVARYSLGEISHGSNLIGMGILGLGIATVAFESRDQRRRFVFGFLYLFIGLGYTSAAFCKLVGTGITWPSGQHLLMWIAERKVDAISKLGSFDPSIFQDLVLPITDSAPSFWFLVFLPNFLVFLCGGRNIDI